MNLLPIWIIYVAATIRLVGGVRYVWIVLRGKARPNPVSWLLWSITPAITFVAALSSETFNPSMLVTVAIGMSPLLVFVASIIKNPKLLRWTQLNITCFIIALTGIGLWALTKQPLLAIALAITADIASAIPTIAKSAKHPYSEYLPSYMMSSLSMVLALLATERLDPLTLAFPIYILVINLVIITFVVVARKQRQHLIRQGIAARRMQLQRTRRRL